MDEMEEGLAIHNVELWECLLSASLIGVRSACASRISLAVDRNAPVMWSAAVRWTLANLLVKQPRR